MALKLVLDSKKIYEKTFQGNKPGYDALQVDQFLDVVIKDYQEMERFVEENEKDISNLTTIKNNLANQVTQLQVENSLLKEKLAAFKGNEDANINNIDYLKKISKLEHALYKLGVNPNSIE